MFEYSLHYRVPILDSVRSNFGALRMQMVATIRWMRLRRATAAAAVRASSSPNGTLSGAQNNISR